MFVPLSPSLCVCLSLFALRLSLHDDPSKATTAQAMADKPDSLLIATWVLTYPASVWHKLKKKKSCGQEAGQSFTSFERQQ